MGSSSKRRKTDERAKPSEPAKPGPSPPGEGESYKPYLHRVASEMGITYFAAQKAVKEAGTWKA